MPWGVVAAVAGAAVSSALAPTPSAPTQSASGAADPFAPQRQQYQQQLQSMMSGNYKMSSDPSYQYQLDQGSTNLSRQMAAQHMQGSGAELAALQTYGQQTAAADFSNQYDRLAQLSGANIGSPAAAGQIIAGQQNQQLQASSAFGNAVGGAVSNLGQSAYSYFSAPTADTSGGYAPSYGSSAGGYDTSFGGASGSFF